MLFNLRLIGILLLFSAPLMRAEPQGVWPKWAYELSDIPASPRVTYGRLENGLRYALLPNRTPPGQVSLRLLVLAGSLNERDDELGYAHYVEHLAFRSTRNFPTDEKIKFLQRLGVGFGPHVNAETAYTHTLYKLDLPENSPATLDGALRILRDFADGIVFDETETNRERGVVLSESSAMYQPNAVFDAIYAGTLIPKRPPIGSNASIKKAKIAGLRGFFDAWYRPENMVVVITGDIDPIAFAPLLKISFDSLIARAPARTPPTKGSPAISEKPAAQFFSETRNGVQVELGTIRPEPVPLDTVQNRVNELRLEMANRMIRRRLQGLVDQPKALISGFMVTESRPFGGFRQLSIVTAGDVYKWPTVLAKAEQELRRALDYGFDLSELNVEQASLRTELHERVGAAVTAPTSELANELASQIEYGRVFTFPEERIQRVLEEVDRLTTDDCRRALKDAWGDSPRYIFITASQHLIKATPKQIQTKYRETQAATVLPPSAVQGLKFAYEDFGPPGEVSSREYVADLDLWLVRFANGVRLNLKKTDFEHQAVRFALRIGDGRLGEPADRPGLTAMAGLAAFFGGLQKYSDDELTRAFNGAHFNFNFSAGTDAFEISASSPAGEFPLALDYIAAYLTDAAFRPEGSRRLRASVSDLYLNLEQNADGVIAQKIGSLLAGDDARIGFLPRKTAKEYSMEEMGVWLRPVFKTGAIEIALAGDFDVDQAIAQIARTFGALPPRAPKPELTDRRKLSFPIPPQQKIYSYSSPTKNRPVKLAFYWPVHEPLALADNAKLQLLAAILQDRLRVQIRVEKGETYSPTAQFSWSDVYPGYASLFCLVDIQSGQLKKMEMQVRELALRFGAEGTTAEELTRAKALALADVHRFRQDNAYWMNAVLADAQEHPWRLEAARNLEHDYNSVTPAEINALAVRFLTARNLFQFTIKPEYQRP